MDRPRYSHGDWQAAWAVGCRTLAFLHEIYEFDIESGSSCYNIIYQLDEYITETYLEIGKFPRATEVLKLYQKLYYQYLRVFYKRHQGNRAEEKRKEEFGASDKFGMDYNKDVSCLCAGIERFLVELEKISFPISELEGHEPTNES